MADLVVTIDGPAASGKSTVARLLAERLGASFLDTGAMYRAVTLAAVTAGVDMRDEEKLLDVMGTAEFQFSVGHGKMTVCIDGVDVGVSHDGSFTYGVNLMVGRNVFNITAMDGAGNEASTSWEIDYIDQVEAPEDTDWIFVLILLIAGLLFAGTFMVLRLSNQGMGRS